IENSVIIKSSFPTRSGSPYRELRAPIIYGLLAHSHSWKSPGSEPIGNIEQRLYEAENAKVEHPRLNADLVCIADLATWTSMAMVFCAPPYAPGKWEDFALSAHPNGWAVTSYIRHSKDIPNQLVDFTPIGTLISHLIQKLAWEDPACRDLAD